MVGTGVLLGMVMALGITPLSDSPVTPQTIYGGELVAPGEWPSVAAVDRSSLLCTGTLIAPNLILTAAHCFAGAPEPGKIRIAFGDRSPDAAWETVAESYGVHPDFCDPDDCKADLFDFAYVVLRDPAPAEYPPMKMMTTQDQWDDLMDIDTPVTMVGYGLNENQLQGLKRVAETVITRFSDSGLEFQAGGMGVDSCQGDSGGPAFVFDGETPLLAGVLSRGYACGDGGFYGIPSSVLCWVSEDSGVDVRPSGCSECDCLNPDPDRGGCDRCTVGPGRPIDALAVLLPLAVVFAGRRRGRYPTSQ